MSNEKETNEIKKKRGRKPTKNKIYFGKEQEQAVVDYLKSTDDFERNEIFENILKPAFTKMIESIIRRYNLYVPSEEFQETFDDTISFLMMKLSCFDYTSNFKAYSYCGTICKNYLIYKLNQYSKKKKRSVSYDDPNETPQEVYGNDVKYSDTSVNTNSLMNELTSMTVQNIETMLSKGYVENLKENEVKVGKALLELIKNWEDLFVHVGSDKFNKSAILMFIKENTMLSTNEIRNAMKLYRGMYYIGKDRIVGKGV